MTTKSHADATTVHLGATVASSDPGAQNGRKLWVDTSAGPPYQLKVRKADDSAWEAVGLIVGTDDDSGFLVKTNNLSDLVTPATARANLGLGTAATHAVGDFDAAGAAAAVQALAVLKSNNLSDVTAATARTNLGLGTAATHATGDFDAVGLAAAETARAEAAEALLAALAGALFTGAISITGSADAIQIAVTGNATQTEDLVAFTDHGGTHGFWVGPTGEVIITPGGTDGLIMSNTGIVLVADGDDPQDAVNRRQLDAAGWQGVWSGATTYAKDALVTGSDSHVYVSVAAANLNHNPVGDGNVHWQAMNA